MGEVGFYMYSNTLAGVGGNPVGHARRPHAPARPVHQRFDPEQLPRATRRPGSLFRSASRFATLTPRPINEITDFNAETQRTQRFAEEGNFSCPAENLDKPDIPRFSRFPRLCVEKTSRPQPSTFNPQPSHSGVALIITLILLSVVSSWPSRFWPEPP